MIGNIFDVSNWMKWIVYVCTSDMLIVIGLCMFDCRVELHIDEIHEIEKVI